MAVITGAVRQGTPDRRWPGSNGPYDLDALPFELFDTRNLVGTGYPRTPFVNSERPGAVPHRGLAIPGQYLDPDTDLLKHGDGSGCIGAQPPSHSKDMAYLAMTKGDDRRLVVPAQDIVG